MKYKQKIGDKIGYACDDCGLVTVCDEEYDFIICHNCGLRFLTKWEAK